ncbi:MAG: hypothetical protein JSS81_27380 [Acidobacteria bacterium]|nr:hypothetical protein [Acidobacteriota bacterium]
METIKNRISGLRLSWPLLILCAVVLALIVVFVVWFVSQERFIYFWDGANYFTLYKEFARKLIEKPFKALDSINVSMRKSDYNNVGVVPLVPFYYVFGPGRIFYILSIAVVYAFSTIVFFPVLMRKITGREDPDQTNKFLFFLVGIATIALWPQLWIPVLLGYVDVAGVGLIFLILWLYFRKNFAEQTKKDLVKLGLALCLLVILRRWYAYWTVGFFVALAVAEIIRFISDKADFKEFLRRFGRVAIVGATAAGAFFALATQIAVKMLKTDYGDIYSAYRQSTGIGQNFEKLYTDFGLLTLLLCAGGVVTMFARKRLRPAALFLGVIFAVAFYLFTRTQDLGYHHNYWVLSLLVVFAAAFVLELYARLSSTGAKIAFVAVLIVAGLANFAVVFSPRAENLLAPAAFAFPKTRLAPMVRNDLEEIHHLLQKLDELTANTDKKIYVLSSSAALNSSVLQNGCGEFEPALKKLQDRIMASNDVDKRDGFPFQMYRADYVVVSDPPGYHLFPEDQRIAIVPAEQLINNQSIGRAFTRLPFEYPLDDGRRAIIYRKDRRFTAEELLTVSWMFVEFYPDRRAQFEITPELLREFSEN